MLQNNGQFPFSRWMCSNGARYLETMRDILRPFFTYWLIVSCADSFFPFDRSSSGVFFLFHYYFQARSGSRIYWRVIERILVNTRRISLVLSFDKLDLEGVEIEFVLMWNVRHHHHHHHHPPFHPIKKITNFFKLKSLFALRWFHDNDIWYVYELQQFEQTFTQKEFPWHNPLQFWTYHYTFFNLYICRMNLCCIEFQ